MGIMGTRVILLLLVLCVCGVSCILSLAPRVALAFKGKHIHIYKPLINRHTPVLL